MIWRFAYKYQFSAPALVSILDLPASGEVGFNFYAQYAVRSMQNAHHVHLHTHTHMCEGQMHCVFVAWYRITHDFWYIIYYMYLEYKKKLFNYVCKRQGKLWQKQLWQVSLKAGDSLSLSCQVKRKTIGLRYSSVVSRAFDYSSMQTRFDTAESFKAAKYFRWGVSVSWVGCDKFSENVSFHKVHILKLAFWQ